MPWPKSSDRVCRLRTVMASPTDDVDHVCCPRAVMSCHAQRYRPCVLSEGGDVMPRPTSFDRVCCPKAGMACHSRRRSDRVYYQKTVMSCHACCLSTLCAALRRCWHATPDVVRPCVLPKGDDGMPRPTSFDNVFCLRAVMSCHARRRSTTCAALGR